MKKLMNFLYVLSLIKKEEEIVKISQKKLLKHMIKNEKNAIKKVANKNKLNNILIDIKKVRREIKKQNKIRNGLMMFIDWILIMYLFVINLKNDNIFNSLSTPLTVIFYGILFFFVYLITNYIGFSISFYKKINFEYKLEMMRLNSVYKLKNIILKKYLAFLERIEVKIFISYKVPYDNNINGFILQQMYNDAKKYEINDNKIDVNYLYLKKKIEKNNENLERLDKYERRLINNYLVTNSLKDNDLKEYISYIKRRKEYLKEKLKY